MNSIKKIIGMLMGSPISVDCGTGGAKHWLNYAGPPWTPIVKGVHKRKNIIMNMLGKLDTHFNLMTQQFYNRKTITTKNCT